MFINSTAIANTESFINYRNEVFTIGIGIAKNASWFVACFFINHCAHNKFIPLSTQLPFGDVFYFKILFGLWF